MDTETSQTLNKYAQDKYKYGFVTDIDSDKPKKGLDEEIIKFINKLTNNNQRLDKEKIKKNVTLGFNRVSKISRGYRKYYKGIGNEGRVSEMYEGYRKIKKT